MQKNREKKKKDGEKSPYRNDLLITFHSTLKPTAATFHTLIKDHKKSEKSGNASIIRCLTYEKDTNVTNKKMDVWEESEISRGIMVIFYTYVK